jgi:hypothetical protein
MLQQALTGYRRAREEDVTFFWDEDHDGECPTVAEIDALAGLVGGMLHSVDDEPADPMKDGKPYITDNERVISVLLLTDAGMKPGSAIDHDIKVVEEAVAGWTDDQKAAAFEWAALSHLAAGDNDDVEVPECPPHVEAIRPKYGS